MRITRRHLRGLIKESLSSTYEQHFGLPSEMNIDVWMNWVEAYDGTIDDLDNIARQLGAPDHSWLPETPNHLGDGELYYALKRALAAKMGLTLDDEPYIPEPSYSHEDLPPLAETFNINVSGHSDIIKKLMGMNSVHAWQLVKNLEDDNPGLKHAYIDALKGEYEYLEHHWDYGLPPVATDDVIRVDGGPNFGFPPSEGTINDIFPNREPPSSLSPDEILDRLAEIEGVIGEYMHEEGEGDWPWSIDGTKLRESYQLDISGLKPIVKNLLQKHSGLWKKAQSRIIKESATAAEMSKIEGLWWNQMPGDPLDPGYNHDFPDRDYAIKFIKALNIDPKDLKIWSVISPEGLVDPYDSDDNPIRLSLRDIERTLDEYNNDPKSYMKVSVHSINYTDTPPEADAYVLIESKGLVGSRHVWTRAVWMIENIMENL